MLKNKTKINLTFFLLAMTVPISGFCFLNIEGLRQDEKRGFYGASGIKASGASGNTETLTGDLTSQNIYKNENNEFIFLTNYLYGEASRQKNTNKGSLHLRLTRHIKSRIAYEVFAQTEFNEFTSLNIRKLLGLGLRMELLKHEKNSIYFGTGAFYEKEELSIDSDQEIIRGNVYASYRTFLMNNAEGLIVVYYQPSLKLKDDYRLQINAGLEFPISKQITMTTEIQISSDTRPPTGIKSTDASYLTGFGYKY